MGGAALLRNAKHHISSTVKNHKDADRNYGSGREGERERKRGRKWGGEEERDRRSFFLQSGHSAVLLISPKSKVTQCTGTIHSTDVRVMFFHALLFCGFGCPQQKKIKGFVPWPSPDSNASFGKIWRSLSSSKLGSGGHNNYKIHA